MKQIEHLLPIPVGKVVGSNIDVFHKNPQRIRSLLQDSRNYPHKAIISLGGEKLEFLANAIYSGNQQTGIMVTWSLITKKLEVESANADYKAQIEAISKSQAVVEFSMEGIVHSANENFLKTLGYTIEEIKGKHHSMFCDPSYVDSMDYKKFWDKLNRGEYEAGEFRRIAKGGREVWISASYNPIPNVNGDFVKVVKYASDTSLQKLKNAELEALSKTQAVINFDLTGKIIDANENFLNTMGYSLNEITGKHHSMFCDHQYVSSPEYQKFWEKLNQGQFASGEFKRIAKNGENIWLNAAYNPVYDLSGSVFKIVKYATDITRQKNEWVYLVKTLSDTASQLGSASEELIATASQLSANAKKNTELSTNAAASSEQVSKGVQSVAASTEEMLASIKEIGKNSVLGSDKTAESKQKADETNTLVNQLGKDSEEIGSIIRTISSIAQQTNLLALNATIEAARAGDAGKGFTVVANEVKELAKQTAAATEEIANKIGTIQQSTANSMVSIGGISKSVEEISLISASIATAVEEQTATTNEVSRVILESSQAVDEVSKSIKEVSEVAVQSSTEADELQHAAVGLSKLATKLYDLVVRLEK